MSDFIVLGAGVTGMTAASVLTSLGAKVSVVEQSSIVGGHVTTSSYCCKATSSCARCGVCVAHTQLSMSLQDSGIALHTSSAVEKFSSTNDGVSVQIAQRTPAIDYGACTSCGACDQACPENCITEYRRAEITQYAIDYSKCLLSQGKTCTACADACTAGAISCNPDGKAKTLHASALLVATGHTPFDARKKPRYGYGTSEKIMTGLEAETALSTELNFGDPNERIAIVQCVGSRDPSIGRNFCSGVCCAYAVRIARMLKFQNPEMHVAVYYIDLQNFDREFTSLLEETKSLGVEFIQGLPFMIDEESDGSLALTVESADGKEEKAYYDRAILSVGIDVRDGAEEMIATVGLTSDEHGFLRSNDARVFTCGTCAQPMSIPESMAAARHTAHQMWLGSSR